MQRLPGVAYVRAVDASESGERLSLCSASSASGFVD
jgi:hypothetical protein